MFLTIIPNEHAEAYMSWIGGMLETPVLVVNVREHGAVCLNELLDRK